jgi:2,3-bisphosphoglycerate-independent phosphoglycerate mutase
VLEYLQGCGDDYRIMSLPDHPTPVRLRTHTSDPVPFLIYCSDKEFDGVPCFCEESAAAKQNYIPMGHRLMEVLVNPDGERDF